MKSPEQYEADLITLLASGPDGDDDADCLHCDMAVGLRGWNPPPDRVLRAAVADDRLWSILERSRAAFKAAAAPTADNDAATIATVEIVGVARG